VTQSSVTQRGSEQADAQFNTDRTHPGRRTVTFSNPPITFGRAEDDDTHTQTRVWNTQEEGLL
jgi:hypothetical protein